MAEQRELSWEEWRTEFARAVRFYRMIGMPKDKAEAMASHEMRAKFYVLAGG